jgi:hypothetical protein
VTASFSYTTHYIAIVLHSSEATHVRVDVCACRWYVIYRVLTEQPDRTVIFASDQWKEGYVIPPKGPNGPIGPVRHFNLHTLDFTTIKMMCDIGTSPLFIADSFLPPVIPFPTLVVAAPSHLSGRMLRDTLNAYWGIWHYMPIPTEEEVLALGKVAFPHVVMDGVITRMHVWGHIPRYVLEQVEPKKQALLWQEVNAVPVAKLVQLIQGSATLNTRGYVPDCVVHVGAAGQDAAPGTKAADPTREHFYNRGLAVIASQPLLQHIIGRVTTECGVGWDATQVHVV